MAEHFYSNLDAARYWLIVGGVALVFLAALFSAAALRQGNRLFDRLRTLHPGTWQSIVSGSEDANLRGYFALRSWLEKSGAEALRDPTARRLNAWRRRFVASALTTGILGGLLLGAAKLLRD
ncbi:MAG: hypothetical protein H7A20_03960 [Rhodanobacteraceae bacterium]|nr:hypothetical protein [Rhodanobacteraceae bacterium]